MCSTTNGGWDEETEKSKWYQADQLPQALSWDHTGLISVGGVVSKPQLSSAFKFRHYMPSFLCMSLEPFFRSQNPGRSVNIRVFRSEWLILNFTVPRWVSLGIYHSSGLPTLDHGARPNNLHVRASCGYQDVPSKRRAGRDIPCKGLQFSRATGSKFDLYHRRPKRHISRK